MCCSVAVPMCCSVAVCCSALQCVAVRCRVLQRVAMCVGGELYTLWMEIVYICVRIECFLLRKLIQADSILARYYKEINVSHVENMYLFLAPLFFISRPV